VGRVLVIEDDHRVARLVVRALEGDGHTVEAAATGVDGLCAALGTDFDLVVLDLMLPGITGTEVLDRLVRGRPGQRILILSAVPEVGTRVACLEAGAADFLAKPFVVAELLARVRIRMRTPVAAGAGRLRVGPVCLDMQLHRATVGDRQVLLSPRELLLLAYLMHRAGQPCTRAELLADVWGMTFDPGSNVVDVYVRRLRTKMDTPTRVETVRNVGYRFVPN
jgi:DNA-binding response OmpR family regulator